MRRRLAILALLPVAAALVWLSVQPWWGTPDGGPGREYRVIAGFEIDLWMSSAALLLCVVAMAALVFLEARRS